MKITMAPQRNFGVTYGEIKTGQTFRTDVTSHGGMVFIKTDGYNNHQQQRCTCLNDGVNYAFSSDKTGIFVVDAEVVIYG
ncbi:hypothetical protein MA1A_gp33 [Pectobacterium phage MA1A]|nr:hypothetical protein MA6_gp28 [Pectobacterium phage MA6]QGH45329.1 hypothetical protein MA1A_gp33 [Pectobacterium phage MA1A]